MDEHRKKTPRHAQHPEVMPLSWDLAAKSKRMLTDAQVVQLYLPAASRGALSMGRFGKGPYAALPYRKIGRSCRYVESAVVQFVENLVGE
jgi:hypothetical protein